MDEQRAWLRAGRKRRLRILAVILCACVLFTTYPNILETLFVFAAAEPEQSEEQYISDDTALPDTPETVPGAEDGKKSPGGGYNRRCRS